MTATLTLVSHHLCPYVQRASIALDEKGVRFERTNIDLNAKPDWFLKISPLGKVPLLQVPAETGETVLFESSVIAEYVEDSQDGAKLHPADALERARHRGWMEFGSSILSDLWGFETAKDAETFEQKRQAIAGKFATVEAALGDGPYFAGARFSLVDAVFAPIFRYFDLFDTLADHRIFDGLDRVGHWREALAQRPSVKAAVTADYGDRLMAFLREHDAYLLRAGRA
ncbi:glutathione S-transferase family protein [Ensifer sp.]|jgi:glutathione S-transferase|uniref:glutathione S-transferase family protein n=1 Tax=Ensifer sp. TaxID=1872086 RepID=UPI002E112D5C|nr:glutathione S-transferase family protein [Ensifer sp.]